MKRVQPWWIAAAGAVIVASVVGVGAVMAQEPTPSPTGTTTAQSTPSRESTPSAAATPDAEMTPNAEVTPNHKATPGEDKPRGGCAGFVGVEAIAGFLGLTEEQLHTELQAEGATLASVAAAHGQDRDALKAFLTDQVATRLAGKVAEGDLTQEEADQRLSEFTSNLDSILDGTVPAGRGFHGRFPTPGGEWEGGSNGSSGTFSRGEGRS